jgi:hypothetical protein
MLRVVVIALLMLVGAVTAASAQSICDLWDRDEDGTLRDGERVNLVGRIKKDYGQSEDGNYEYDLDDGSCGAFVWSAQPIRCSGTVTVVAEFDEEETMYEDFLAFQATGHSCR